MSKILIVYASLTGNTEEIAELIAEGIKDAGSEAVLKMVDECNAAELLNYDAFILGAYTWGDGELPDEFLDFAEEMEEIDLNGKAAAVFGSGDTGYRIYCGAVDTLEEKLKAWDVSVLQEGLKIEYGPSQTEKGGCRDFGRAFVQSLGIVT
ncbi:flavodoxin [Paenibacillus physcomitrellae]|uniref:Flavodoxin n=1 Tax=Paenibacillus physcomitrellae TaxID=1619311 RepID=A0ABQ1FS35_9BACL|nr:flavodoxin [Paenibacillus physcomitrellae]GGA28174.1 putative flavodoxin-2 [Paenibacillus physcomitrellae]